MTSPDAVPERVVGLMPGLIAELSTLVAIPSVAFPGSRQRRSTA